MTARSQENLRLLVGFTGSYLLLSVLLAWRRGSLEFAFYIGVMFLLVGVVWAVHRRVHLTMATLWCLSLWGLAHMAGGLLHVPAGWPTQEGSPVLYALWIVPGLLKYDHVVHAFGFGVTTWVCWQGLAAALEAAPGSAGARLEPTPGLLMIAAAAGMGFGALNEVIEFVAVLLVPETGVGGYVNTGWDLVANAVGASVAAVWIHFSPPPRHG